MGAPESQPVVAVIMRDNPQQSRNIAHLQGWAIEEHGYEQAFVIGATSPNVHARWPEFMQNIRESRDRNSVIGHIENSPDDVIRGLAMRNPILHFIHAATTPHVLSSDKAADLLRATQDTPRLVGGLVLNEGKGLVEHNYSLAPGLRDPFAKRVLDEIIEYSYCKPEESPLSRTYPIHHAHPYNLAMPFDILKRIASLSGRNRSFDTLTEQLARLDVESVLLPLIAVEIGLHGSFGQSPHADFAQDDSYTESSPANQRTRASKFGGRRRNRGRQNDM